MSATPNLDRVRVLEQRMADDRRRAERRSSGRPCTVYGLAAQERDTATKTDAFGRLTAESFDHLAAHLPAHGCPVDLEHNGVEIGELIWGEIDDAGGLSVVCVLDDGAGLVDYPAPIYFSPTLLTIGEGVSTRAVAIADAAALVSLSLTTDPASLGARPVRIVAGDVRSSSDRNRWPLSWSHEHPLLVRALDLLAERRTATRLLDRRDLADEYGGARFGEYDGKPGDHAARTRIGEGGIEQSAHRGRILRVH